MSVATDDSQAATALLTEHLQYTPLSLIDDIINSVNTFIFQGINSLETGLSSIPPERLGFKASKSAVDAEEPQHEYPEAKQEIEEGLHKLETLLNSTVDKTFDRFEIYVLRNILTVPSGLANWVKLNHYEGIDHASPASGTTPQTIELLRRKLAASRNVSRSLTSEYNRNEAILAQLRGITDVKSEDGSLPNLCFMNSVITKQSFSGQQPLTTNTNFALSQLPALKASLLDLKARLGVLKETELNFETAKDELREERRQYIEQRTKSHVTRAGQSNTTDSQPLPGKQTETAEVEALEKAANMFIPP